VFYSLEESQEAAAVPVSRAASAPSIGSALTPGTFEEFARRTLEAHYRTALPRGSIPGVRKEFDFVSPDQHIVGDAKYYTLVRGTALPPAKFATIAEHVWLLEKTAAPSCFLIFGHDREVPLRWLARHGNLASSITFFFLPDDGGLERLGKG
jgi:hypothetical protein